MENVNFVPTAEHIIIRYYPKYSTLRAMTNDMIANLTIDPNNVHTVNVYIDLYRMLLSIYHREGARVKNYTEITSAVINMCAHIRAFYKNSYGVHTKIFIVYNNYVDIGAELWQSRFIKDYNIDAETSMRRSTTIRGIILNNIPLIRALCESIYDVYFVERPVESMVVIYDLINKEKDPNIPHIIFSFCPISIQLPAMCNNTFIFRVSKNWEKDSNGQKVPVDYFTVISKRNALIEFVSNSRNFMVSEKLLPMLEKINPELLSFFIILAGVKRKEKNIVKLMNIDKLCELLYEAITINPSLNRYNEDIEELYNAMKLYKLIKAIDLNILKYKFKAIDLIYNYGVYKSTTFYLDDSYLINIEDSKTMKQINQEYFKDNPLDLERL